MLLNAGLQVLFCCLNREIWLKRRGGAVTRLGFSAAKSSLNFFLFSFFLRRQSSVFINSSELKFFFLFTLA